MFHQMCQMMQRVGKEHGHRSIVQALHNSVVKLIASKNVQTLIYNGSKMPVENKKIET